MGLLKEDYMLSRKGHPDWFQTVSIGRSVIKILSQGNLLK